MLATDGKISFAIFLYDNLDSLTSLFRSQIGFNAGDRQRFSNIESDSLENINVFRIDGM